MIKIVNHLIADGGIPSKNSPSYSKESFLIALKKEYTYAIKTDLYQTKDNFLVLLDNEIKNKLKINDLYIKNHNYKDLAKLNFGNKVKSSSIITLNELINSIIDNKKNIMLNVSPDVDVKILKNIINNNQNISWYLASSSLEILEQLSIENSNYKIGIFAKTITDINFSFDFYLIEKEQLMKNEIKKKLKLLNKVFITNIVSKNEVKKFDEKNIYFISKNINKIYKN